MTTVSLISKVFSSTQLLFDGGSGAFSLILEYSPSPLDYGQEESIRNYYKDLFDLVTNYLYDDLKKPLEDFLKSELGEEGYYVLEEKLYKPITNPNLCDPGTLLPYCSKPLENILSYLYLNSPAVLHCLLTHSFKFEACALASRYKIVEYNLASDTEFIDVCSLLLMGYCIYNENDESWYKYSGKIWKRVKSKSVVTILMRRFSAFIGDICSVLESRCEDADEENRKDLEKRIDSYKKFTVKKNYTKVKTILEPIEDILKTPTDIGQLSRKEYSFFANNGVIDLIMGRIRPYKALDFATFCTPVSYIEEKDLDEKRLAGEKTFRYFIESFTSENYELENFLQTWFGYGITGLTCEQQFLVILGRGSNSKSIFANLFMDTLGEYFANLPRCVIIDGNKSAGQATPQFEKLATARLGVVTELKSKDRLDIENIKNITGGDALPSRALYRGYENIKSNTKLFIITNEMAKAIFSYAYARRVIIFPSLAKFVKGLRDEDRRPGVYPVIFGFDRDMKDRYVAEAFLRFLVQGACKFFSLRKKGGYSGIPLPEEVRKTTENYLSSINDIGRYILDITDNTSHNYTDDVLFENFKNWYFKFKGHDTFMSFQRFQRELEEMGISPTEEGEYIIAGDCDKLKPRYPIITL